MTICKQIILTDINIVYLIVKDPEFTDEAYFYALF